MKRLLALALCGSALIGGLAQAADYDVVILDGRVMDPETNFDAVRNVGIKDGRIVTITESHPATLWRRVLSILNNTDLARGASRSTCVMA